MLKRLFYASASIFMLALAYHLGARSATAQAPGNPVAGITTANVSGYSAISVTANGDVYASNNYASWTRLGNVFSGPTPATQATWGQVKARYRQAAPATPENK